MYWRKIAAGTFGLLILGLIAFYGWQRVDQKSQSPIQLVIYAFSTQEEVFTQGIFPAFQHSWKSSGGSDLNINAVFGPSGTLAGQISLGAPADVAIFSNADQVNYLKISRGVEKDIQPIFFGSTPIVIITRPGNPFGIENFSDLGQPGLHIIHADPRSSGVGDWSLLAEYGSKYLVSGDLEAALQQVARIWKNVHLMAPSARALLTLFELGDGDALITYEQDARLAEDRGVALDIVIPSSTLLAQPVAVAIDNNIKHSEQAAVTAFLDFLTSAEGQEIFSRYHLRPISQYETDQLTQEKLFTVDDLGGWAAVYSQVIKPYWEKEIFPTLMPDD